MEEELAKHLKQLADQFHGLAPVKRFLSKVSSSTSPASCFLLHGGLHSFVLPPALHLCSSFNEGDIGTSPSSAFWEMQSSRQPTCSEVATPRHVPSEEDCDVHLNEPTTTTPPPPTIILCVNTICMLGNPYRLCGVHTPPPLPGSAQGEDQPR
ncbi:unnamed protein product [Pleuronectes platessa]|uniref:Uncharacterized protein n=1 Tax=Pleuronectes platessa TaxID=8262 RepID=A0A9N7U790_PLEPL|nr:unnamed protein product [Pleuronectes platessa]